MALGADRRAVLAMVLRMGLGMIGLGVGLGLAATFALTRVLSNQLFDVAPHDPLTLLAVAALLTASGLLACYIPARRATRVDPMVALRYE
jgi:ABC-type antimicrobial peptide transport system permease subunit